MLNKLWRDKRVGILQREIEDIRNAASDRAQYVDAAIADVRTFAERLADRMHSETERADRAEHRLAELKSALDEMRAVVDREKDRVDSFSGSLLRVERQAELGADQASRMAAGLLQRMDALRRSVGSEDGSAR